MSETSDEMMACSRCNKMAINTLVEVYTSNWKDWLREEMVDPYSSQLCETCLVGRMVPVIRSSNKQWEFAMVEGFAKDSPTTTEGEQHFHSVRFMDDEVECANIESNAFTKYIGHYKLIAAEDGANGDGGSPRIDQGETPEGKGMESPGRTHAEYSPHGRSDSSQRHSVSPDVKAEVPGKDEECSAEALSHAHFGALSASIRNNSDEMALDFPTNAALEVSDQPKYSQRLWTPEEDKLLMHTMESHNHYLRWPLIAKSVPGRTGKQCRERYLNHLKPTLKMARWSAIEDSLIFRLHHSEGSKWAMMAKMLRGRTDNSIKNRYHHLKRKLERYIQATNQIRTVEQVERRASTLALLEKREVLQGYEGWMLQYIASKIEAVDLGAEKSTAVGDSNDEALVTSPTFCDGTDEACTRCGFSVPSEQTGRQICSETGWCESCTRVSPCANGDMLRVLHDGGSRKGHASVHVSELGLEKI